MSIASLRGTVETANDSSGRSEPVSDYMTALFQRVNEALNSDFCPTMNRWVYWMKEPIWCLAMAVGLSAAVGVFVNLQVLFLTGILCVLAIMGTVLPWLTIRGLTCHLSMDQQRGRVGQPLLVRLRICNRYPWPAWGLSLVRGFHADWDESSRVAYRSAGVSLARVPGWSTLEFTWTFVPTNHGQYPLQAPELETGFPFGFVRCACPIMTEGRATVWPALISLAGIPDSATVICHDDSPSDRSVGEFGDLLGTRFFRNGDSLRRIHWAQTARQQQLIVCERQAMARSHVRLVVDLSAASHPECGARMSGRGQSADLVIRAASGICESLHRQCCRTELQIGTEAPISGDTIPLFRRQMDALATAEVHEADDENRSRSGRSTGTLTILVTTAIGLSRQSVGRRDLHIVCVGEDAHHKQTCGIAQPWIRVTDCTSLTEQLPQLWKGVCHVG